ncbi:MAG: DUF3047 domain-containing protein [Candidatus Omnitrophica bacterium]|nr:DUF3047 domain-containing protein [Candidatus Omnitrophota bacterium]
MLRRATGICLSLGLLLLIAGSLHASPLKEFNFDSTESLEEWEEKIIQGHVHYELVDEGQGAYVRAQSDSAASGYYYKVRYSVEELPMISWQWRVSHFPDKPPPENIAEKDQDDFAARVYVIFPALLFTNSQALEYVWSETLPEGTIESSAFSGNIKIFVVQSGPGAKGEWFFEERNVYEDYTAAFGRPPKARAGAVAFMTDSDNTETLAGASFDEIKFGYKKE